MIADGPASKSIGSSRTCDKIREILVIRILKAQQVSIGITDTELSVVGILIVH